MAAEKSKKSAKMSGYLEKRGKLTITGKWKKWWCVLEGQLLLYYKSRTQYLKLSPCCGSLNVALVRSVQPHADRQIHVMTHSQLVILRASSKEKQQNWFLAFISVLPKHNCEIFLDDDNGPLITEQPNRLSEVYGRCNNCTGTKHACNDDETIHGTINDSKYSDFGMRKCELRLTRKSQFDSTSRGEKSFSDGSLIRRVNSNFLNRYKSIESDHDKRCSSYDNLETVAHSRLSRTDVRMRRFYSVQCVRKSLDARPDNDYMLPSTEKSLSCRSILLMAQSREYVSYYNESNYDKDGHAEYRDVNLAKPGTNENQTSRKVKKKESFNILRKVFGSHRRRKVTNACDVEVQPVTLGTTDESTTVTKTLQEYPENHNDTLTESCKEELCSKVEKRAEKTDRTAEEQCLSIIPEECSCVPTRLNDSRNLKRLASYGPVSRIDEYPPNYESPVLPIKQKINSADYSLKIAELNSNAYDSIGRSFKSERNANAELDSLLLQLSMINHQEQQLDESSDKRSTSESDEDPDYDFPIPHASLIDRTSSERILNDSRRSTKTENDFLHSKFGSQNLLYSNITPDSLEAPWMLVDSKRMDCWSADNYMLDSNDQSESDSDSFLDSLDTRVKYTYTQGH